MVYTILLCKVSYTYVRCFFFFYFFQSVKQVSLSFHSCISLMSRKWTSVNCVNRPGISSIVLCLHFSSLCNYLILSNWRVSVINFPFSSTAFKLWFPDSMANVLLAYATLFQGHWIIYSTIIKKQRHMYLQTHLYITLLYPPTIKFTSYCMITGALLKLFYIGGTTFRTTLIQQRISSWLLIVLFPQEKTKTKYFSLK